MERKLTTEAPPLLLSLISFFKPYSLLFLVPHSWTISRFTHNHLAGAAASCSTVSKVNWSKNLFSLRLQGSCAMSAKTLQAIVTTEIQRRGENLPPHCLQKLPILCLSLATLSYSYLKNGCEPLVPAANRLGRNVQLQPKWAHSIKHKKRNCHHSRVRTLPTASSHQRALRLSPDLHWHGQNRGRLSWELPCSRNTMLF